jgi:hypothetical protein
MYVGDRWVMNEADNATRHLDLKHVDAAMALLHLGLEPRHGEWAKRP